MALPFRWDLSKREQLGSLLDGPVAASYDAFEPDLRRCCARVIASCDDSDLVFVGRSPESIYDYLSGLLQDTSWADRPRIFNFSFRDLDLDVLEDVRRRYPRAVPAIKEQFSEAGLDPRSILRRPRPVAFVDLVWEGETFGHLSDLLLEWARQERRDVPSLRRSLRFVGITRAKKTSPNTWRWQQDTSWARTFRRSSLKGVSVPGRLWYYLAESQDKVSLSNPPWRWSDATLARAPRKCWNFTALRLAAQLFDAGRTTTHRAAFAREMTRCPAMRHQWFRSLVLEIR